MAKKIVCLVFIVVFLISLTACTNPSNNTTESNSTKTSAANTNSGEVSIADNNVKNSAIIAMTGGEPTGFDPQKSLDSNAMMIYVNIYDNLIESDGACSNEIRPKLAESWDISDDGLVYTFHLKTGVKFHNGEKFSSADVKYTLERAKAEPATSSYCTAIESVEAVDAQTVIVTLNTKWADFLRRLGTLGLSIVNEKAITEAGADYGLNPVGTGAYRFVEWKQGESVILTAFEEYHMGVASIKDTTFKFFADTNTAMIALQNGEIDAIPNSAAIDAQTVENDTNLTLLSIPSDTSTYISINTRKSPFDDIRVREAIRFAIDKEMVLQGALTGAGIVANSNLHNRMLGYNADNPETNLYDLEKAKALMAEAGYADGFSCTLKVIPTDSRDKAAQIIQAQLKAIGIELSIEVLERATFLEVTGNGDYEIVLGTLNWPDADNMLTYLYGSKGPFNWQGVYSNSEVDQLLLEARQELDHEKRSISYDRVVQIAFEYSHNIPIYFPNQFFSARKGLEGVQIINNVYYPCYRWSWSI